MATPELPFEYFHRVWCLARVTRLTDDERGFTGEMFDPAEIAAGETTQAMRRPFLLGGVVP